MEEWKWLNGHVLTYGSRDGANCVVGVGKMPRGGAYEGR